MEATVCIDGKDVKFRATAAVPRLYRLKFRRDIMEDVRAVQKAVEKSKKGAECIPIKSLEMFEDMAYIMAKHADPAMVPQSVEEWMDQFDTMSIYTVFPVIEALWAGNMEAVVEAKKKLDPPSGT